MCHGAIRARVFDRDPICGEHYGRRPCRAPHKQAGHMAAPNSRASPIKKSLANTEPSTHGTKCPSSPAQSYACNLLDCRRPGPNGGLAPDGRHDSERQGKPRYVLGRTKTKIWARKRLTASCRLPDFAIEPECRHCLGVPGSHLAPGRWRVPVLTLWRRLGHS